MDALAEKFSELKETLSRAGTDQSYQSLWENSGKFRQQVFEILTLNGMGGWDLPLGDLVALTIGSDRPPLLAQYNFLLEDFAPSKNEAISDAPPEQSTPPQPTEKRFADVFPLFDTGGALVYPRGVMAADHGEFEAVYMALTGELQEMQESWSLCHPAIALLWSDEVRALSLRLVELFGLDPARLNIHQVCELAIAYQGEPGLLPQLGGLVEVERGAEDESTNDHAPMPKTHSTVHFLAGALSHAGVRDWRSLLEGMTSQQLSSYQQGFGWAADGGEAERKKERSRKRIAQLERDFLGGGEAVPHMVQQFRRQGKGIGL